MQTVPGYSRLREIARSRTTVVYRAQRNADDASVILKTHVDQAPSIEQLTRLQHEFDLLGKIDSPNVVRAHELVELHPGLALVIEDRGGQPIARSRAEARPTPLLDALRIARDVVSGLGALHRAGVVHRDINPWNILHNPITRETQIADLSHASRLRRGKPMEANPFTLEASVAYMSPEQTGRTSLLVDYRADFYSLGVTLYELLTGAPPFSSEDPLEVIHAHIAKTPIPPSMKNGAIPRFLSDLLMRLLAKNPEDRYQSAEGVGHDLDACLALLRPDGSLVAPLPLSVGAGDAPLWFELPNRLYGRERELAAIGRNVERAAAGEARVVFMKGRSGLGKSSLVAEIGGLLARHRGYFAVGKFEQLGGNTPYAAVIQALRALARRILIEPEAALAAWKQRFELALGRNAPLIVAAIPELETLLGPQPPVLDAGPLEARARLNFAFGAFLQAIALPEHPLAIFLDDLQWADSASLQLLESLFLDGDMHHLILLGAYRDDEIGAAHPAALTLKRLQEDACSEEVALSPLGAASVAAMLADALGDSTPDVRELAELCAERCAGNPMLIRELITSLVEAEIIRPGVDQTRAPRARTWRWDIAAVRRSPLTDNVAKLISQRISGLAEPVRRLVQQAACFGNAFLLSRVARAAEIPLAEAARLLRAAVAADIVYVSPEDETKLSSLVSDRPMSPYASDADVELSFRHDLLLQAAYAAIPTEERAWMHLKAGRALRSLQSRETPEQGIFPVLNQLNRAKALVTDRDERLDLAWLNLVGGQQAAASSAHEAALGYYQLALDLLDEHAWETHPDLMFELHLRAAEAACAAGELERSDALIQAGLSRARPAMDRAKLLKVRVMGYTLAGRSAEALEAGSEALRALGGSPVPPAAEIRDEVQRKLAWIDEQLRARSIPSLREMPTAERPEIRMIGEILGTMNAPTYFTGPDYIAWVAVAMVEVSLRHGSVPALAMGCVSLGSIFSNALGRYREGHELGELSVWIADRFNDGVARSQARLVFANNYFCRTRPIRATFGINDEGFRAAIEAGDLAWAGYFQMFRLYHPLSAGEPLARLEALVPEHLRFCRKTNNQLMCDVIEGLQAVLANLQGATDGPRSFDLPGRPEAVFVDEWTARRSGMALAKFNAMKAMALYLHGDAAGALRAAQQAELQRESMFGQYTNEEALYYGALSLVRLAAEGSGADRSERLEQAQGRRAQLERWADLCPENFAHAHALVEAELQRIAGDRWEAVRRYDEAIRLATEHRFPHGAALANELAGRFWLEAGSSQYGQTHLREAHRGYAAWGATRKAELLEREFAFLRGPGDARAASRPEAAGASAGFHVDVASIFKATGVVSSSLVEAELHERLLRIAAENAGAKRGALILHRDGQWFVEAEIHVPQDRVELGVGLPLSAAESRVPQSIINYVRRLKTAVVLDDALQSDGFRGDPYYAHSRPVSVLCVPIIRQSAVTAILYLENDLVTGAFRADQAEILRILAGQAAISLDNAQLYEKLHRLNVDLHKRFEEAQEAVRVKTEFVANASHELRTPLNSLVNIPEALLRDFRAATRFTCAACAQDYEDDGDERAPAEADAPRCPACKGALAAREQLRFTGDAKEHHFFLRQMIGAAEHLRRLVNDLLDFSRIESGKMQLDLQSIRVSELFAEVSAQTARAAALRRMTVSFEADEQLTIEADRVKLGQVLINLVENALKFSSPGQPIEVSAREREAGGQRLVCFSVKDKGIGIPADKLEEIFETFKQVDGSHTRVHGGVGLGLALCRRIVSMHRGRIWAESRLGEGSTLRFELPAAQSAPARLSIDAAPIQGTTVLLVDDDALYLDLTGRALKDAGYVVHCVNDPRDALDAIQRIHPSAIILDVMMPRVNGITILERLKANPTTCAIPVLVSTAYHSNRDAAEQLGARWLPKPWSTGELLAELGGAVRLDPPKGAPLGGAASGGVDVANGGPHGA